jgi:hypothetical protein
MLETQPVASVPAATREPRVFDLRYLPWGSLLIMALLVFIALGAPLSHRTPHRASAARQAPTAGLGGGRESAEHLLARTCWDATCWNACATAPE